MNLIDFGFNDDLFPENTSGIPARVTAVHKERYGIVCDTVDYRKQKQQWGKSIKNMKNRRKRRFGNMSRTIKSMEDKYLQPSLDMIRRTFTNSESAEDAQIVVSLVQEIRSNDYYIPELELIMVDENDEVIGYSQFSRFHLGGKFSDELLLLTPVAVKTELQRQHISKELVEYGLDKAKEMGFKVVIVEGNPDNYRSRGFRTSADFGITAAESIRLPAPECLMVQELEANVCKRINGVLDYTIYKSLI